MSASARPLVFAVAGSTTASSEDGCDTLDEEDAKIHRAAAILRDAVDGIDRPALRPGRGAYSASMFRKQLLPLLQLWSLLGMFIEFFVEPYWCLQEEHQCLGDNSRYYMSQLPRFRRRSTVMQLTNILYIAPFILDVFLQSCAFGMNICKDRMFVLYVCCVVLYGIKEGSRDLFSSPFPPFPVLPFVRAAIFIFFFPRVTKEVMIMARSFQHVLELLWLGGLLIAFFAWMALVVFPPDTEEGKQFFPALLPGMWSLLVLLTTANFPDVMLPAYRENRASVIFFLIFMLMGMFFLVNVITAVVMSAYQRQVDSDKEYRQTLRQAKMKEAFELLTEEGALTVEDLQRVISDMANYAGMSHVSFVSAVAIDTSQDGLISREEFGALIGALHRSMVTDLPPPCLETFLPDLKESPIWNKCKDCAEKDQVGWIIDVLLACNLTAMMVEMWPVLAGTSAEGAAVRLERRAVTSWRQSLFTWVFICEAAAKIALLGFPKYMSKHTNQFDLVVTAVIALASFAIWCPYIPYSDWSLIQVIACARLFRLFRLLNIYKPYHDLAKITWFLLPKALDVFMILAIMCYLFSAIGVSLFGGLIDNHPSSPHYAAVSASSFGQAGYWANNFNDFSMGFVTLFELLVVNNWFLIADGFSAAAGVWARAYFVTFYILGVLVGLNLVVSFIIGAFMDEYEASLQKMEDDEGNQEKEFHLKDPLSALGVI